METFTSKLRLSYLFNETHERAGLNGSLETLYILALCRLFCVFVHLITCFLSLVVTCFLFSCLYFPFLFTSVVSFPMRIASHISRLAVVRVD